MKTWKTCLVALFGILVLGAVTGQATVVLVDDSFSANFSGAGFTDPGPNSGWGFSTEKINNAANANATWSTNLAAGTYWIQARWVTHSAHTTSAGFLVNGGSVVTTIDQRQTAGQGASGTIAAADSLGSGWITLGKFTLSAGLNSVTITNLGSGYVSADTIRFSTTDFLVSEQTATVAHGWTPGNSHGTAGNPTDTPYFYNNNPLALATYNLLAGAPGATAGNYGISLSWGVAASHSSAAHYILDLDGNFATTGDQTLFTMDQTKDATGATVADGSWSGFKYIGTFALTTSSAILVTNGAAGTFLTLDEFLLSPLDSVAVPEPSTMLLVGLGGWLFYRRARGR